MFFAWNVRRLNSDKRHTMTKDWTNIHKPFFGAFLETHILETNKERISRAIPRGCNFMGNYESVDSGRIVVMGSLCDYVMLSGYRPVYDLWSIYPIVECQYYSHLCIWA